MSNLQSATGELQGFEAVQKYLSDLDKYRLNHILKLLGARIIPVYFFNQNPKEFCKWQMNACRQTALIVAYFFNEFLKSFNHTPIKVKIWDGEFKDNHTTWYNHAWVTAQADNTTKHVFIDVARISTYPLVVFSTRDTLPEIIHPGLQACGTKTLKMIELDYDKMLTDSEYYTGKTGLEVCQDIEKMMLMYGYDMANFKFEQPF